MKNNIKRWLCAILCLCMLFALMAAVVSCGDSNPRETEEEEEEEEEEETKKPNKETNKKTDKETHKKTDKNTEDEDEEEDEDDKDTDEEDTDAEEEPEIPYDEIQHEGDIQAIKFTKDIVAGALITEADVKLAYVHEEDVPINAIRDLERVIGKYLTVDVYVGEFVFAGKLTTEAPSEDEEEDIVINESNYIVVTDYITENSDVTKVLQDLIDTNPRRTLYFPDGTYTINKPLVTSADPAKAVSLRLSNYAIIEAASSFSGDALIRIGAGSKPAEGTIDLTTSTYIMGGIINAKGKAKGLSVEGGRDIFVSNVSIKNATVGLYLGTGDTGRTNTDVENVNITCTDDASSVGLLVEGAGNTFTTVRISKVHIGVEVKGEGGNTFRNVHVVYSGSETGSVGFYDKSKGNSFDMCFSQNFGTGFRMAAGTSSSYSGCLAFWDDGSMSQQYGFASDGAFNSAIRNCRVNTKFASADSAYLKVGASGGKGQVIYPLIDGKNTMDDKSYSSYLKGSEMLIS